MLQNLTTEEYGICYTEPLTIQMVDMSHRRYGSLDVCSRLDKPLLASLLIGEVEKFQSNAP